MPMIVEHRVYDDGVVAAALLTHDKARSEHESFARHLAIKWLLPTSYRDKQGVEVPTTNIMGGETDWFILPLTLGAAIGKQLIEQKAAGLPGFDEAGFAAMVEWLLEGEDIFDGMCY